MRSRWRFVFLFFILLLPATSQALAEPLPAAYAAAAGRAGVPAHLLYAVASTESSRPGYAHPWPWTANIAGKPFYFESREALYQTLSAYLKRGKRNFDVGLMQINWFHNADLFGGDLWLATDPYRNLDAGAGFLKMLQDKHGSLEKAVALYHAGSMNTPARLRRGSRYRERVWARLRGAVERFS